MHWIAESSDEKASSSTHLELRHLTAFQQVYLARDYTGASYDLHTNRKSIRRMIDRLEKTFQCSLFNEERGIVTPTPFAERLFNDLRFLNSAQESLEKQIRNIRETGRLLKIGSSASVFRTAVFRRMFRELQTIDQIKASYSPLKPADAAKALAAGTCDVHAGCWKGNEKRFISLEIGEVNFRMILRGKPQAGAASYMVTLDDVPVTFAPDGFHKLGEAQFLHWLDHPDDCPAGTRIFGPDIPHDVRHWTPEEAPCILKQSLHLNFLRQHPYEFLSNLSLGIQTRMKRNDHS